jgi:hypothetical protein
MVIMLLTSFNFTIQELHGDCLWDGAKVDAVLVLLQEEALVAS